MTMHPVWACFF